MPLLSGLGWDGTDPTEVVPEYTSGRGRVDFALLGTARRAAVFVEVKGVGRAVEGDRQLFEYAFHEGVPLCVLTDGREWSFYLPSGQGSYDDRRIYRLQIDDRAPDESERVLVRYLARDRILSGAAFEDAQSDYRDATGRREATVAIPAAWAALLNDPEDLIIDLVTERAETICGFRPAAAEVLEYLRALGSPSGDSPRKTLRADQPLVDRSPLVAPPVVPVVARRADRSARALEYLVFGDRRTAANANTAFVDILKALLARHPDRINALAEAVRGTSRTHVARSAAEIYPKRPDLARAAEIAPGWLVGLNISNRHKMAILRIAADVCGVAMPGDIVIDMPTAD